MAIAMEKSRVLVVDDEPQITRVLRTVLTSQGYQVRTAAEGVLRTKTTRILQLTGIADEIIVVDTGSSDATKEIALRHGARVFDFAWCDNFAAARNESVRHASGPWLLWPDADEFFDDDNRAKLQALLANLRSRVVVSAARMSRRPRAYDVDSTAHDVDSTAREVDPPRLRP